MGNSLASADQLVGVVLAAGAGTRLRPLTDIRPKALCPIGHVPLVDLALRRVHRVVAEVAVNVHHGAAALVAHLDGRVHLSMEPTALGTAGALGNLRGWIDGRDVLVHNVDSWHDADLVQFAAGWDRSRPRLLTVERHPPADFGTRLYAGVALLPWHEVAELPAAPAGLYEVSWRHRDAEDLELIEHDGVFFDCGTPARYLAANLAASGGGAVVGAGARVEGTVVRSVVWPGVRVWPGEELREAIRAVDGVTVLVR
jgi:MurNAc alpha-1-phosphate uridylyltransferase